MIALAALLLVLGGGGVTVWATLAHGSYTFDDGSVFRQTFNTSASVRSAQTINLPGVSTSQVTIAILDSVLGDVTGGKQPFDKVAISEVVVSAR